LDLATHSPELTSGQRWQSGPGCKKRYQLLDANRILSGCDRLDLAGRVDRHHQDQNAITFSQKNDVMKIASILCSLVATFLLMTDVAVAQPATTPMADLMRSEGRIYVVIAVILTILGGLLLYLVRLDRKISRLEKE
jgi:hypothetical protein